MTAIDLATQLQQLYQRFGQLPGVRIELQQDLVAVSVRSAKASAEVFLQGAQISRFQPHDQPPVLFMSEQNRYQEGQPLRGGVPISWPWFGDFQRNPQSLQAQLRQATGADGTEAAGTETAIEWGAHGFLRSSLWQLDDIRVLDGDHQLQLSWQPQDPRWPLAVHLQLVISVAESLTMELTVVNKGAQSCQYALALHTYFQVGDVTQVAVRGLEDVPYLDALDAWQSKPQLGALTVDGEVDRVFVDAPRQLTLEDLALGRAIVLTSDNLPSLVAWNPWREKGSRLSQFGGQDYRTMLCLENAALLDNICQLGAGEKQTHLVNIRTKPL